MLPKLSLVTSGLNKEMPATKVNIALVCQLRQQTQYSLKKIKTVLLKTDNNYDEALTLLQTMKPSGRQLAQLKLRDARQGVVAVEGSFRKVMVELNCESDFVGRSELFLGLSKQIATSLCVCFDNLKAIKPESMYRFDGKVNGGVWNVDVASSLKVPVARADLTATDINYASKTTAKEFKLAPVQTIKALIDTHIALTGENILLRRIAATSSVVSLYSPIMKCGSHVHGDSSVHPKDVGRIGCLVCLTGGIIDHQKNINGASAEECGIDALRDVEAFAAKIAQHVVGFNPKDTRDLLEEEYLFGGSVKKAIEDMKQLVEDGVKVNAFKRFEVGKE